MDSWPGARASVTRTPLPGSVSYGGAGGARAVEQLRLVPAEVHIATMRNQVLLSMSADFENFSVFKLALDQ